MEISIFAFLLFLFYMDLIALHFSFKWAVLSTGREHGLRMPLRKSLNPKLLEGRLDLINCQLTKNRFGLKCLLNASM